MRPGVALYVIHPRRRAHAPRPSRIRFGRCVGDFVLVCVNLGRIMFRASFTICTRRFCSRLVSSISGESALPSNLRLPSNLIGVPRKKAAVPTASELPVLRRCDADIPSHLAPVQTWLHSLGSYDSEPLGVVDLHPDVFSVPVRLDILHAVEVWQRNFKRISHAKVKSRAEVRGGGRKPWKQKGGGRARQGSIRSPLWRGGGVAHGPRGPTSYYYMLPMKVRVQGLKIALTAKLAQDYLHVIDTLEIPTPDPHYLEELVRHRQWGESVLIVDVGEEFSDNVLQATANMKTINIIPAIGLNVHSMLKHESLVLTLEAVKFLEKKLLWHDCRFTPLYPFKLPYSDLP
ncbi:39S ribosomal protein L4, mitochondrial [Silurus meridionalis]|nr:39S ribosomal protein L4, mitochondrial [Silurus meridionalis]